MNNNPNNPTQPPPTREAFDDACIEIYEKAHTAGGDLYKDYRCDEMMRVTDAFANHLESENARLREELRGMEESYQIAIRGLKNVYSESPNKKARKIAMSHYKDATALLAALREQGEGAEI